LQPALPAFFFSGFVLSFVCSIFSKNIRWFFCWLVYFLRIFAKKVFFVNSPGCKIIES
jgi:hypothetical protein